MPKMKRGRLSPASVPKTLDVATIESVPWLALRPYLLEALDAIDDAPSYRRILTSLGAFEEDGPLTVRVTATRDRADGKRLGVACPPGASAQRGRRYA